MASELDTVIGARLRSVRQASGCSQEKLAESLGITFQQIQKYEKGSNRLSLSSAIRAAKALGVSISSLLPTDTEVESGVTEMITDKHALRAAEIFTRLPAPLKIGALRAVEAIEQAVTPEAAE